MNSLSASRVRFACRVARLRAALTHPARSSHVASCPACQRYLAASAELDQQLMAQARQQPAEAPAGLDDRIFQAIQPTLRSRRQRRAPNAWWAIGLAGMAAAIALVVVLSRPPAPSSAPAIAAVAQPVTPENLVATAPAQPVLVDRWSDRLWSALATDTPEATSENPLQREIAAVQADTRSALRFLARNFLPESLSDAEGETVRSST